MAEIISGIVYEDGTKFKGEGFEVKLDVYNGDDMYIIEFPSCRQVPTVICQAWEIDDAITCVTVGFTESPTKVYLRTLDKDGEFVKNGFTFIAVSNG